VVALCVLVEGLTKALDRLAEHFGDEIERHGMVA
jgi:hypothetical protein